MLLSYSRSFGTSVALCCSFFAGSSAVEMDWILRVWSSSTGSVSVEETLGLEPRILHAPSTIDSIMDFSCSRWQLEAFAEAQTADR